MTLRCNAIETRTIDFDSHSEPVVVAPTLLLAVIHTAFIDWLSPANLYEATVRIEHRKDRRFYPSRVIRAPEWIQCRKPGPVMQWSNHSKSHIWMGGTDNNDAYLKTMMLYVYRHRIR